MEHQRDGFLDKVLGRDVAGFKRSRDIGEQGVNVFVDFSLEANALK